MRGSTEHKVVIIDGDGGEVTRHDGAAVPHLHRRSIRDGRRAVEKKVIPIRTQSHGLPVAIRCGHARVRTVQANHLVYANEWIAGWDVELLPNRAAKRVCSL